MIGDLAILIILNLLLLYVATPDAMYRWIVGEVGNV
jgi:hypothetical protein